MFAPLTIMGRIVGLIGLAKKSGGFNDEDLEIATNFGQLAALSLKNSLPSENKERIFQYGFDDNTGQGLFLSREILGINGMSIMETGEEGVGGRFEIVVPPGHHRRGNGHGTSAVVRYLHLDQRSLTFSQSLRKRSMPMSVRGCLNIFLRMA